jgi:hypothetical protein
MHSPTLEPVEKAGFPPVGWVQPTDGLVDSLGCAELSSASPTLQKTFPNAPLATAGFWLFIKFRLLLE